MKERITITIDEDILRELDAQIDGVIIKNRSHAIELNLTKALQRRRITQAIILAGGKYDIKQDGKEIPTPMVIIHGKPILEHNILMLRKQGITDIILAVGYKRELIQNYFGDGTDLGVKIRYIEDDQPLGTAGVIRSAAKYISGTFIVCNADELKKIDIRDMFDFHRKQGTLATLALTSVPDAKDYGVVVLNGNRVYSFIEKPKGTIPSNLINAGLYIFEPEVISQAPRGFGILEEDVFPKLAQTEDLAGYVFYGQWMDVRDEKGLKNALRNW